MRAGQAVTFCPAKVLSDVASRDQITARTIERFARWADARPRLGVIREITWLIHRELPRRLRLVVERIRLLPVPLLRSKALVPLPHVVVGDECVHVELRELREIRF